ncbi:MAG: hypothetical protein A2X12_06510 [Bacteroidetes bacterium GWE2_29_8]|nr:MAG: hypothetical protein A2X12_06510 [Bacteroidetes bacterium GWE2_29_8]
MALLHSFEKSGNYLFKNRGQLPIFLFILAIPFIYKSAQMNAKYTIILNCVSIMFAIIGIIIRVYTIGTTTKGTSGRNTDKQVANQLNSEGIYSIVRHPLYLGNYFMWAGIVIFTYNVEFLVIFSLMFWLYYERIMFAEEQFLSKKFGDSYINWSNKVPAFLPNCKRYLRSDVSFSLKSVLRREYSGILATSVSFCFIEVLRNYFLFNTFKISKIAFITIIVVSIISLILKLLKKYTLLLTEKDRS